MDVTKWLRLYDSVVDDPKVQCLTHAQFRFWITCLCLASRNAGILPSVHDICFSARLKIHEVEAMLVCLEHGGLLDRSEFGLEPHNWGGRQYKSDLSTDRVKRFRERDMKRFMTVSETAVKR